MRNNNDCLTIRILHHLIQLMFISFNFFMYLLLPLIWLIIFTFCYIWKSDIYTLFIIIMYMRVTTNRLLPNTNGHPLLLYSLQILLLLMVKIAIALLRRCFTALIGCYRKLSMQTLRFSIIILIGTSFQVA